MYSIFAFVKTFAENMQNLQMLKSDFFLTYVRKRIIKHIYFFSFIQVLGPPFNSHKVKLDVDAFCSIFICGNSGIFGYIMYCFATCEPAVG